MRSREKARTTSLALRRLGIGKRSRNGKLRKMGWKIWRLTADWSLFKFASGFERV